MGTESPWPRRSHLHRPRIHCPRDNGQSVHTARCVPRCRELQDGNDYLRTLVMQAARVILLPPASWPKQGFGVWLATPLRTRLLDHVQSVWQLVGRTIGRSVRRKYPAATFDCRDHARRDPTVADVLD